MELKYYLRGLGLGIIVTAIIMGVAAPGRQTMTDEEIISRAKQLGMIEDRVLSESALEKEDTESGQTEPEKQDSSTQTKPNEQSNTEKAVTTPTASAAGQDKTESGSDAAGQDGTEPGSDGTETGTDVARQDKAEVGEAERGPAETDRNADTQAETESENKEEERLPDSDEPMVITIGSGDGSYAVSRKLADIGAISSPENFDTFLCENGYDKKIRTGTYTIPADASDEQMARIITGAE